MTCNYRRKYIIENNAIYILWLIILRACNVLLSSIPRSFLMEPVHKHSNTIKMCSGPKYINWNTSFHGQLQCYPLDTQVIFCRSLFFGSTNDTAVGMVIFHEPFRAPLLARSGKHRGIVASANATPLWKAVKFLAYKIYGWLLGDFWVVDFFVRKAVFFTCVICQDASNAAIWSAVRKDRTKNWAQKIKAKNKMRSQRCHAILNFSAQSVKDLIAEFHWASLHSVPAFDLLAETKDAERSCHAFTLVSNQWASRTRWTDKTLRHLWHLTV